MDEEPQQSAPVPSPHPSTGLEASGELELTPERPKRRREPRRPAQLKQHDIEGENSEFHNCSYSSFYAFHEVYKGCVDLDATS